MRTLKSTSFILFMFLAAGASAQIPAALPGRPDPLIPIAGGGVAYIHAMREASEWESEGTGGSLVERKSENPLFIVKLNSLTGMNAEISIASNPQDPQHLVAAWMNIGASVRGLGTAWSKDGGATWHESFLAGTGLFSKYDENDPVVVAGENGVFHLEFLSIYGNMQASALLLATSTDGGMTFPSQQTVIKDSGSTTTGILNDKNWMAIDLSNSAYRGNLYTAWLRVNQGLGTQSMVFSRRAKDSTSWSAPIAVNDTTYFGGSSQQQTLVQGAAVAVGVNGEVYMAWTQFGFKVSLPIKATGYLKFDRSTDGGLTFGRDKTVNSHVEVFERYNTASIYQRMHGFPQMAVDRSSGPRRGRIYICYTTMDNGDADVFLVSSDNRGDSWSAPIRVNNDPLRNGVWQFFGQITVSPNGVISIPYYATQGTTSVLDTYVADSWDGGATFLTRKISTHSFTSPSSGFIGDYLGNVAPGDYAFPAWADLTGTNLTDVLGLVDQIPADTGLEPAAPADIRLEGIYPNPLFRRASAEVLFRVNRPASIRLSVADPLGRLVRVLTDETCLPGSHTLSLEGSGLGQGVYFLLLESTGVRQVKKLVVLE